MMAGSTSGVANVLLDWWDVHGRKDLPWQHPRTPWRVWVSEIMLQQTQVQTVIPYFERFMDRFPTVATLAQSPEDDVLAYWAGLGYYSRARNLYKAACMVMSDFQGNIPSDPATLATLPGIGESTAAAIASQAFGLPAAILDANVKRVLARHFEVNGTPDSTPTRRKLQALADACMPQSRCADYTQAIMDLGATCCTPRNPDCGACPLQRNCLAFRHSTVSQYPEKRIRKAIPTRSAQFLIMIDENGLIYLEKRPSPGIWGGLWCFPVVPSTVCGAGHIRNTFGWIAESERSLIRLKHTFTHFHWDILPKLIHVKPHPDVQSQALGCWFEKHRALAAGIPKPVSVLLGSVDNW